MLIGPVADIGEHVLHVGEVGQADEGNALATHMGEGAGLRAVIQRHEMAADAGTGEAAIGQFGGCRVRTAGTEGGDAAEQAGGTLDGGGSGWVGQVEACRAKKLCHAGADAFRRQFHQGGQQGLAGRGGLAADVRAFVGGQMVEGVADLRFHEAALFLDHQDGSAAAGEFLQALGFERPGHGHFVDGQLRMLLQTEATQRVHRVLMRLADGDQADRGVRGAGNQPVQPVGAGPGVDGGQTLVDQAAFQFGAFGGEFQRMVQVEAVRRQR